MFQPGPTVKARQGAGEGRGHAGRLERFDGLSTDRDTVRMQTDLAYEIRGAGAEVIMSCYTQSVLREADALEIVHTVAGRGGQFAKLVSQTPHKEDVFQF